MVLVRIMASSSLVCLLSTCLNIVDGWQRCQLLGYSCCLMMVFSGHAVVLACSVLCACFRRCGGVFGCLFSRGVFVALSVCGAQVAVWMSRVWRCAGCGWCARIIMRRYKAR